MERIKLNPAQHTIEVNTSLKIVVYQSVLLSPLERERLYKEFYQLCFPKNVRIETKVKEISWMEFQSGKESADLVLIIGKVDEDLIAKGGKGIQSGVQEAFDRKVPVLIWYVDPYVNQKSAIPVLSEVVDMKTGKGSGEWSYTCDLHIGMTDYEQFVFIKEDNKTHKISWSCKAEIVANAEEQGISLPVKVNKRLLLAYLK